MGIYGITAHYNGDTVHQPSISAVVDVVVNSD